MSNQNPPTCRCIGDLFDYKSLRQFDMTLCILFGCVFTCAAGSGCGVVDTDALLLRTAPCMRKTGRPAARVLLGC